MTTEAQRIFEKVMAGVPPRHRKVTFAEAKRAVEKRMTMTSRETFQKIARGEPRSFASFEEAVEAIREGESCSTCEAMSKAADHHPDLLRMYNDEGRELSLIHI